MVEGQDSMEGSRVLIKVETLAGETSHEGMIIPPAAEGHMTLKLDNGYNVSHPLDRILSTETISPPREESTEPSPVPTQSADLPRVCIIHTGGTIASKVDYSTGAVVARFNPEEMLAAIPELSEIANIETVKLGNMWSDDMRPRHWNMISTAVAEAFASNATGVVITQGTDTMHLTSTALSMAWAGGGGRPVGRIVLTGSQRSSDRGSSDAAENLICAVHWAAHGPAPDGGLGDAAVVVMHSGSDDGECAVLPGCSVRKNHSSRRDAFQSVNSEPIARISWDGTKANHVLERGYSPGTSRPLTKEAYGFDESLRLTQLVAGPHLGPDVISALAGLGHDAIVIQGTGLGHLPIEDPMGDSPENAELKRELEKYIDAGGIVLVSSQCINGPVNNSVYSKGRLQQEIGVLGHDSRCGPDAAIVKLHHLLSRRLDSEQIRICFSQNLVGENPESMTT